MVSRGLLAVQPELRRSMVLESWIVRYYCRVKQVFILTIATLDSLTIHIVRATVNSFLLDYVLNQQNVDLVP